VPVVHFAVKRIQVCSNEENTTQGEIISKDLILRTSGSLSNKLDENYPWVDVIQVCSSKGEVFFIGEITTKIEYGYSKNLKFFLLS
jgi:hypoxanthine-guanine phosphoribosyltransferase